MIGDPFTCNYCGLATNKATESHGDSGYCVQCEIAFGLIKIHKDPEENQMERVLTMAIVTNYRMAMRKAMR